MGTRGNTLPYTRRGGPASCVSVGRTFTAVQHRAQAGQAAAQQADTAHTPRCLTVWRFRVTGRPCTPRPCAVSWRMWAVLAGRGACGACGARCCRVAGVLRCPEALHMPRGLARCRAVCRHLWRHVPAHTTHAWLRRLRAIRACASRVASLCHNCGQSVITALGAKQGGLAVVLAVAAVHVWTFPPKCGKGRRSKRRHGASQRRQPRSAWVDWRASRMEGPQVV